MAKRVRTRHSFNEIPDIFRKPFFYRESMGIRYLYSLSYDQFGIEHKRLIFASDNLEEFVNSLKRRGIDYHILKW